MNIVIASACTDKHAISDFDIAGLIDKQESKMHRPNYWKTASSTLAACFASLLVNPVFASDTKPELTRKTDIQAIIGGELAEYKPWMLALVHNSTDESIETSQLQFCGAALIDPSWALTAAHCVYDRDPGSFSAISNSTDLDNSSAEILEIESVTTHPYFYFPLNDIALLKLSEPVQLETIELVSAASEDELIGEEAIAYGWGVTNTDSPECEINFDDTEIDTASYTCDSYDFDRFERPVQAELLSAEITVLSNSHCAELIDEIFGDSGNDENEISYGEAVVYENSIVCTKDIDEESTPCFGDSGGPLTAEVDGQEVLLGIVAGGYSEESCNPALEVELYSRVSFFEDYIEDVKGRNPELDFDALCPLTPELSVEYAETTSDLILTTVSWTAIPDATRYLLHFTNYPEPADVIDVVELGGEQSEFSIELSSDQQFYLALQAFNSLCNSGLSNLIEVIPEL